MYQLLPQDQCYTIVKGDEYNLIQHKDTFHRPFVRHIGTYQSNTLNRRRCMYCSMLGNTTACCAKKLVGLVSVPKLDRVCKLHAMKCVNPSSCVSQTYSTHSKQHGHSILKDNAFFLSFLFSFFLVFFLPFLFFLRSFFSQSIVSPS